MCITLIKLCRVSVCSVKPTWSFRNEICALNDASLGLYICLHMAIQGCDWSAFVYNVPEHRNIR